MKLLMTAMIIVMFADNLTRQGRATSRPRERYGPPRIGRRRLYERLLKKLRPEPDHRGRGRFLPAPA